MRYLYILLICFLSGCGLLRKKETDVQQNEKVVVKDVEQTSETIDTGKVTTTKRTITFNSGENPFTTPEAKSFMDALFSLSALNAPAQQLDSAFNDLKKKYADFSSTGNRLLNNKLEEEQTTESKGLSQKSSLKDKSQEKVKEKVKSVKQDSTAAANIPWYAWLAGILAVMILLLVFIPRPRTGMPLMKNPPLPPAPKDENGKPTRPLVQKGGY